MRNILEKKSLNEIRALKKQTYGGHTASIGVDSTRSKDIYGNDDYVSGRYVGNESDIFIGVAEEEEILKKA